jgi:polysaccharide export outer membrane protein
MSFTTTQKQIFSSVFARTIFTLIWVVAIGMVVGAQRKPVPSQQERPAIQPPSADRSASAGRSGTEANTGIGSDYKISPDDLLEIKIEDAPELSRSYQVNTTGFIEMPVLGLLAAKQKTASELARLIATELREQDYLKNPNVVVTVKQVSARTYFIQGAVHKTGSIQIEGRPSLLTIISLAGGLIENHGSAIFILRPNKSQKPSIQDPNSQIKAENSISGPDTTTETQTHGSDSAAVADYELIKINLAALYKGQFDQNRELEPGDIVNIPRADVFFVAGEVVAPGSFPLKDGTTLRQAISMAQGMTFKAKGAQGIIFREDPVKGSRQDIKVDIGAVMSGKKEDITILANDVIIVPNSQTKSIGGALLMAFGMNATRLPVRY